MNSAFAEKWCNYSLPAHPGGQCSGSRTTSEVEQWDLNASNALKTNLSMFKKWITRHGVYDSRGLDHEKILHTPKRST